MATSKNNLSTVADLEKELQKLKAAFHNAQEKAVKEGEKEVAKLKKAITSKVGNKELKLDYKENKNITTGYKITVADYQLDATVDNQLQNLKQTILN